MSIARLAGVAWNTFAGIPTKVANIVQTGTELLAWSRSACLRLLKIAWNWLVRCGSACVRFPKIAWNWLVSFFRLPATWAFTLVDYWTPPPHVRPRAEEVWEPTDENGLPLAEPTAIPPGEPYEEDSPEAECMHSYIKEITQTTNPGYMVARLTGTGKVQFRLWEKFKQRNPNLARQTQKNLPRSITIWEGLQNPDKTIHDNAIATLSKLSASDQLGIFERARNTNLELAGEIYAALIPQKTFACYVKVLCALSEGKTVRLPCDDYGSLPKGAGPILEALPAKFAAKIVTTNPDALYNPSEWSDVLLRNILFGLPPKEAAMTLQQMSTMSPSCEQATDILLLLAEPWHNPRWIAKVLSHMSRGDVVASIRNCRFPVRQYKSFVKAMTKQNPELASSLMPTGISKFEAFGNLNGSGHSGLQLFLIQVSPEDVVTLSRSDGFLRLFPLFLSIFRGGSVRQVEQAVKHLCTLLAQQCVTLDATVKLLKVVRKREAWPAIKLLLPEHVATAVATQDVT
ncbi:MAG: hypothetical protein LBB26_04295 [Puniceicoccales bacterium]|nr:hypothetical protein [Puniceicoccales bacterium]